MPWLYENIWRVILMALLLCASAFFSGSETAFFNLSRRQIAALTASTHRLQHLAAALLKNPKKLLIGLLFGNMVVNVSFFALSSILSIRAGQQIGLTAAAVTAPACFFALLLLGEMLPKSLAQAHSKSIALTAALPALICLKLFAPVLYLLDLLIAEPALRLLLGPHRRLKPISHAEFKLLIEASRTRGLITDTENRLLGEIIEFARLKVRQIMRPRVDIVLCPIAASPKRARDLMRRHNLTWLTVYTDNIDNIAGVIRLRKLILEPDKPIEVLLEPANFVPEQKTVESLLDFFSQTKTDTAIVVDEYGGIAGLVNFEDIAEELFGPLPQSNGINPIEQTGPTTYRLAGNLAIHDWAEAFGIDPAQTHLTTIAGLITALLQKIPKPGDCATLQNVKFTVEKVTKQRIETVILTFEPLKNNPEQNS